MKRSFLLILVSVFIHGDLFSQSGCGIKKAHAFYTVHMPGTIRVDEQGNQVRPDPLIERVIYLESVGNKMPVSLTVSYDNKTLKASLERVMENEVIAGKTVLNQTEYRIKATKGYSLWKLQLETAGEKSSAKPGCKRIILRFRSSGKWCKTYLYNERELEGMPRY
ncbi:MAG: hypothetical protein IPP31_11725 [Chitinophagaceae bacterium]|nr:hypothetical protein [Chitinophagaceae bacterium]